MNPNFPDAAPLQVVRKGNSVTVRLWPHDTRYRLAINKRWEMARAVGGGLVVAALALFYFARGSAELKQYGGSAVVSAQLLVSCLFVLLLFVLSDFYDHKRFCRQWSVSIRRGQTPSGEQYTEVECSDPSGYSAVPPLRNPRAIELVREDDAPLGMNELALHARPCIRAIRLVQPRGSPSFGLEIHCISVEDAEQMEREWLWLYNFLRGELDSGE